MKFFMPVCAIALALAASAELASATTCQAACPTTNPGTCTSGNGKTAIALTKPSTLTCATGKFAYIKSLQVADKDATKTDATALKVSFTNGATTVLTVAADSTASCTDTYTDVGKTAATADIQGKIECSSSTATACEVTYTPVWDCQAPDSCSKQTGTAAPTAQPIKDTPIVISRPTTETACATGYFAYLSSLYLGLDTATDSSVLTVTFAQGTANTAVTSTALKTTCDSQWADVGKADTLTGDVKINVACSSATAASCNIKYKATWTCKTADTPTTTTATPTTTTATPTTTTATPTTTTSGSTAASVAVWSSALVTAMAGANLL